MRMVNLSRFGGSCNESLANVGISYIASMIYEHNQTLTEWWLPLKLELVITNKEPTIRAPMQLPILKLPNHPYQLSLSSLLHLVT